MIVEFLFWASTLFCKVYTAISNFSTVERKSTEYQYKVNSTLLAKAYLDAHPEVFTMMLKIALEGSDHSDHDALRKKDREFVNAADVEQLPTTTDMPFFTRVRPKIFACAYLTVPYFEKQKEKLCSPPHDCTKEYIFQFVSS